MISIDEYCEKVNTQIGRSSFSQLPQNKVNDYIKKWEDLRVLDKKWANYIKSNYCKPGTMNGLIKHTKKTIP